jgi:2-hydroxychromene-2-carboxylate isomerase
MKTVRYKTKNSAAALFALAAVLLAAPFATAQEKIDWDTLKPTLEAPGARDAVPPMQPIPDMPLPSHDSNWSWEHIDIGSKKPQKPLPAPLSGAKNVVTEENPLKLDVFYSMRSPYSYLTLYRLAYLNANYNVDVSIKVIFPIAVRESAGSKDGKAGGLSGRWYYFGYSQIDMPRTGLYQGVPFRFANPDPVLQDIYPQGKASMGVAPLEKQPYITWLVRLAAAAQLEGKTLEYCLAVSPLIWGARAPLGEWPMHVKDAVNSIGMDYDAVINDIQKNPKKYDAVWDKNASEHAMTGQGGVPTMAFNGEPFFGQDRFNQVFWRLRENGLTVRKKPREPMVAKPLRWPAAD